MGRGQAREGMKPPHVKFFGVIRSNEFSYGITGMRVRMLAIHRDGRCVASGPSGKSRTGKVSARRVRGREKRDLALIMHRARTLRAQHIITVYLAFKFREAKMRFNSIPRAHLIFISVKANNILANLSCARPRLQGDDANSPSPQTELMSSRAVFPRAVSG